MPPDRTAFDVPPDPGAHWSTGRKKATNGSAKSDRRFQPKRFGEIALSTDCPYFIKGILPREGLAVVWGPPKCGKSFWVYDLVMHAALDWEYRGRRTQHGTVVYIACEGERGLGARTEAFRQARLTDGADPPFWLLTTRLDLVADVDELTADVTAAIGTNTCAAIVIDTLNRSIAGSESRDDDMSAYVKAADKLREAFRAAVVIIHHCGINGERPRGHTSLTGAADAQIAVKRDAAGQVIATVEFMKDGAEGDVIASRLAVVDVGVDEDGEAISSCVVEPAEAPSANAKAARLSPAQGRALQLLADAIDTAGETPPASNHIPPSTRCVSEDLWREYCYRGAISSGDQHAKRMAFKRAAEALVAAGRVGKWEPVVWLI
ncbi:MAG TPA: AAA family ATPase [Stellaceae bacterium]|nr:AAA family ATPase [Stellaceae bacterium]